MNLIDAQKVVDDFYRPKAKFVKIAAIILEDETEEITLLTHHYLSQFDELGFLADLTKGKAWVFRVRYLPKYDDIEIEALHIPASPN